ncbi:MAG: GIY-YIG nuclease family protein, partial [Candidatus Heimdallarchaeota archaeon]|nr:GIY-YIG nuclease family protein [Candidatus Heimdallarchaeota archaeon]
MFIRIRTPCEDISCIPTSPGIYRFIDAQQEILYIGASKNLQNRISQYFRRSKLREKKCSQIQKLTRYIEYQEFETEESAFDAERLQIWTNSPKLNIRSNGIHSFSYLIFRKEPYFHLLCCSNDKIYRFTEHDSVYRINLHSKKLQELIDQIRKNLKLCTSSNKESCWEYQLNLCHRSCPQSNRLEIEKGNNNIAKLINTLTSIDLTLLNEWNTQIDTHVEKMQFEEALKLHISLHALKLLRRRFAGISFLLDQNRFIFTFPVDTQNRIQATIYSYRDGRIVSEEH